jgi:hypothetical protein
MIPFFYVQLTNSLMQNHCTFHNIQNEKHLEFIQSMGIIRERAKWASLGKEQSVNRLLLSHDRMGKLDYNPEYCRMEEAVAPYPNYYKRTCKLLRQS